MHTLWTDYTKHHYKPDAGKSAAHIRLVSFICRLQQSYATVCPYHNHQFFIEETAFASLSISKLRHWLSLHEKVILAATKLQLQAEKLNQHLLTHFFAPSS